MFSIADTINRFWDWIATLSFTSIANTYWFLFFIEVPRYYLLEYLVIFNRLMTRNKRNKEKELARFYLYRENPLISILVPGKNEGKNIYKMVKSLNEQTYRHYEIIVVDDGSNDDTKLICTDLYRAGLITHYLRLETRGGKAAATNYGANMARGKYIVSLDADSSLDRDALENVLLPFYLDNEVKAVGGCIEVRNYKETICSSLQAFEYLKRIQVGRTVTSALGIYHIISGAFGAFEHKTLKEVGFWDIGPGLDGDITQKIRKAGYKVKFAEDAICMTNVPTKWYKLYHQRIRWSRSLVRFRLRKHIDILLPTKNWSILNWLSNMESVVFDCVFNFLWLGYMIQLAITFNTHIVDVLLLGYFIRVCLSQLAFILVLLVTERKKTAWFLYRFMPLMSPYTGYFLRFARLEAHLQELFFRTSYKDEWNPKKTSRYAQLEGI